MIILNIRNKDRAHLFQAGEVIQLKVVSIYMQAPGKWRLEVDDVTPLPGAEPTGYGCGICGIIEQAEPDGSLPDGWTEKKYQEGSYFLCKECRDEKVCRVCGCTDEHGCEEGCHWIEDNLCSTCAGKGG